MKHILTFVVLLGCCFAFSQQTFYSRESGINFEWDNPANWSIDPSGEPAANIAPGPLDDVIIRDSIYHDAGKGYTHFGNVSIESGGAYHIFTTSQISDPYFFKGNRFYIGGNLHTSSDFTNQDENSGGELVFDRNANVFIGDDLILLGFTSMIMNNDSCGDGFTFDDLYVRGAESRVCGVGRLLIPHQIRVWDNDDNEISQQVPNSQAPADLTDAAREQLRFQLCEGFRFYNDQKKCLDGVDELIEGEGDFSLPVELVRFYARYDNGQVQLNWTTASELNNDFFTIERSIDGSQFFPIMTVPGAGTSQNLRTYNVFDKSPTVGQLFYRLKQTDFDGTVEYSRVLEVTVRPPGPEISVYPNPLAEDVNVYLRGFPPRTPVQVSILDMQGKELALSRVVLDNDGTKRVIIDEQLVAGTYFIITNYSGQKIVRRAIKY